MENSVYFTSDRDGYLCVWMQRLDPSTKHPIGAPIALEHFHNSMGRDAAVHPDGSDLVVARDKVVINLPRRQDDIWSMKLCHAQVDHAIRARTTPRVSANAVISGWIASFYFAFRCGRLETDRTQRIFQA